MTYSCRYRNNPAFPYSKRSISNSQFKNKNTAKKTPSPPPEEDEEKIKKEHPSFLDIPFIHSILEPVEKLIGRKISFDDILLLVLIYILFTEKESENDNKTLILCLLFILFG